MEEGEELAIVNVRSHVEFKPFSQVVGQAREIAHEGHEYGVGGAPCDDA